MPNRAADIDSLIERGLDRYGAGDIDGALMAWEEVLELDPDNHQAISYVDYVRLNYDILSTASPEPATGADLAPFAIHEEPEYVIEVAPGPAATGEATAPPADAVDEGWFMEEATHDLTHRAPEIDPVSSPVIEPPPLEPELPQITIEAEPERPAVVVEMEADEPPEPEPRDISFDEQTREYASHGVRPSELGRPPDAPALADGDDHDDHDGGFQPEGTPVGFATEATSVRPRDLGFVQPRAEPGAPPSPGPEPRAPGADLAHRDTIDILDETVRASRGEIASLLESDTIATQRGAPLDDTVAKPASAISALFEDTFAQPKLGDGFEDTIQPTPAAQIASLPLPSRVETTPGIGGRAPAEMSVRMRTPPPVPPPQPIGRPQPLPIGEEPTRDMPPGHVPGQAAAVEVTDDLFVSETPALARTSGTRDLPLEPRRPAPNDSMPLPVRDPAAVSQAEVLLPYAQTRDLERIKTQQLPSAKELGIEPLVGAPTRELGIRPTARASSEVEDAPTRESDASAIRAQAAARDRQARASNPPGDRTHHEVVLPFDPIDARAAQILDDVDADVPPGEAAEDRTRRRISALFDRAIDWHAVGELDKAVAAVDLALSEDPSSALGQKLIHRNRDTVMLVFQAYLGDLERQPQLAKPLHELASAAINPRAAFLLSRIDGTLSIDEILDVSGMPRMEAYRHLCQLFLRGILK